MCHDFGGGAHGKFSRDVDAGDRARFAGSWSQLLERDLPLVALFPAFMNAEDPKQNFAPSPGRLEYYVPPGGPHVRVDSACYSGYSIPPNYDSMIAKLIVKGVDRKSALAAGRRALREFHIGGVKTTIPFHLDMLEHTAFIESKYDLGYVDGLVQRGYQFGKEGKEGKDGKEGGE